MYLKKRELLKENGILQKSNYKNDILRSSNYGNDNLSVKKTGGNGNLRKDKLKKNKNITFLKVAQCL